MDGIENNRAAGLSQIQGATLLRFRKFSVYTLLKLVVGNLTHVLVLSLNI